MAKKSKNNNIYYIAAAVIVVVIIVVLMMRKPAEPEVTEPEVTEPEVVEEEPVPTPSVPTEYVGDQIISNAVCVGKTIQATIKNTGTETVEIGRGMTIQLNGMAISRPVCEKTTVAAGESIKCDNLAGPLAGLIRTGGKQNEIVVKLKAASAQATVTCD